MILLALAAGRNTTMLTDIDGIDYQILIEADYIVNAAENEYSKENIKGFINKVMQTNSGSMLARQIFCV